MLSEFLPEALRVIGLVLLGSVLPSIIAYFLGYNKGFHAQKTALSRIFAQMSISPYSARDTLKALLIYEETPEDIKELIKMCLPDEKAPEKEKEEKKVETTQKAEKPKNSQEKKQKQEEEKTIDLSGVVPIVGWGIVLGGSIFALFKGITSTFAWFSGLANQEKVALIISVVVVLAVFLNVRFNRPRRRNYVSKNPDRLL